MLGYSIGLSIAQVYRGVWTYTGLPELRQLTLGVALGALMCTMFVLMVRLPGFPRSVVLLHPLISLFLHLVGFWQAENWLLLGVTVLLTSLILWMSVESLAVFVKRLRERAQTSPPVDR